MASSESVTCFDEAMARDAPLDRLFEENLRAEDLEAAFDALAQQLERIADPADQQALRMLLLRAARIAKSQGRAATADYLIKLAVKDADWLVTPEALETCRSIAGPIHVTVQDGPAIDAVIQARTEELSLPTGPDLETKYRFTALTCTRDCLAVTLAPATWTSGRKFHAALQRDPSWASKLPDGSWMRPVPFADTRLPGIAVVHAIIVTSDDQVIAAQRSSKVTYAPLHWSVSFEEQLNQDDMGLDEDAFTAAARRGFNEEFGADIPARDVIPLATVLQIDLMNLGLVMLLRSPMTEEETSDSWRSTAMDGWEAKELRGLPLDNLATHIARLGLLHPTSELRGLALERWLREG